MLQGCRDDPETVIAQLGNQVGKISADDRDMEQSALGGADGLVIVEIACVGRAVNGVKAEGDSEYSASDEIAVMIKIKVK